MANFKKSILLITLLFLFRISLTCAQEVNPGADIIFNDKIVSTIKITMAPGDKAFLLADENKNSEDYLHASLRFKNNVLDTLLPDVGIRLRGNTSRDHPKKSFKIDFKEFGAPKFMGYKKFNLKAENNDPGQIRELMTLQTFRQAGVPAARSHHTRVYMNGEYMGLYLNVEQIDDEFVQSRFGNDTGNLYKCTWGTTLEDNGQIYDPVVYELETNKAANDRSILADFVRVLNQTPDANFKIEIRKVLHVETAIKYFAVEALTGHWDGYSYLKNNLYIYENPGTGLIEIIPYDVDNSFGMDWIGRDWATRDLTDWANHSEPRPLNTRLLAVEEFRNMYYNELKKLCDSIFTEEALFPKFDFLEGLITSSLAIDTYFPLTFGFGLADFFDSYDKKVATHVPYGMKPYVTTRLQNARQQVPEINTGIETFAEKSFTVYPNPSNGRFIYISATAQNLAGIGIKLYNSTGQEIGFRAKYDPGKITLNFNRTLPAGFYILSYNKTREKFIVGR